MAESKGEIKIRKLLEEADVIFVQEFSFPDLKSMNGVLLRFDFALFETPEDLEKKNPKALIEFDGEQHYERKFQTNQQFIAQQSNDKRKNHYCAAKHINLLRVPYLDYELIDIDYLLERSHFFD